MSNPINEMLLQPSPLGEVFVSARDVAGPTSYTTGGVTVSANGWAMLTLKTLISDHLSQDGLYYAKFIMPRGAGYPTAKMLWYPATGSAPGVALNLGTLSAAATQSTYTTTGLVTVLTATPPPLGSFIVLSNGAAAAGQPLNGVMVYVTAVVAGTSYSFYFGQGSALHYTIATDTLKYQVVQVNSNNLLQVQALAAPITGVLATANLLTITQANSLVAGQFVYLNGPFKTASVYAAGAIVQVASATTTGWTANWQGTIISQTSSETAVASLLVTNGGVPVAASPSQYGAITNTLAVAAAASVTGLFTLTAVNNMSAGNIIVVQQVGVNTQLNGSIATVIATSLTNATIKANGWTVVANTQAETVGVASVLVTGSSPSGDSDGEATAGANLSASYIRVVALGN
jgi:hypothetical protein